MSGSGAPQLEVSAAGKKIYVISTSWHTRVMDGLVLGAMRELERAGAKGVEVHKVPGAFELPLAAKWAFDQGADAVSLWAWSFRVKPRTLTMSATPLPLV